MADKEQTATKQHIVIWDGAGPHLKGDVIEETDANKVHIDHWTKLGAIAPYEPGEKDATGKVTSFEPANSPLLATGDSQESEYPEDIEETQNAANEAAAKAAEESAKSQAKIAAQSADNGGSGKGNGK